MSFVARTCAHALATQMSHIKKCLMNDRELVKTEVFEEKVFEQTTPLR